MSRGLLARRRALLVLGACGVGAVALAAGAADHAAALAAIRQGGVVVVMRHAVAPGTFDPEGFTLGDCRTQRNLDDAGRAQARRIGDWFRAHALAPATVRSSQWCRCRDTARLAFGSAVDWPALNSQIRSGPDPETAEALRAALAQLPRGGFEVWVTHQVNINHLAGEATASGEAVVLRPADPGAAGVRVLARLRID